MVCAEDDDTSHHPSGLCTNPLGSIPIVGLAAPLDGFGLEGMDGKVYVPKEGGDGW